MTKRIYRAVPLAAGLLITGLLVGCSEQAEMDKVGMAAELAQAIATEQDHVTVPELADWIIKDQRDYELIDIRERAEFHAGHIDGARHIPLAALMSEDALATLPPERKVVIYSNGTAHAAQAAVLLRLIERDAYALLGGYNYWHAYLKDPESAGVAEMDPVQRAQYQAVACYFEGDYVAASGLTPKVAKPASAPSETGSPAAADPLGLGLGLGLGSSQVQAAQKASTPAPAATDPLGLGLGLGLGSDKVKALQQEKPAKKEPGTTKRLLIKAEC